jgi:hypothetical protein
MKSTRTYHIFSPPYSCTGRGTNREKKLREGGIWCSCRHHPTPSHSILTPCTPGPFIPAPSFLRELLVGNMMKDQHFPMLGIQSIHSSQGLGRHLASSLHSDHVLIQLAHFQDLTPYCQGEVVPMTDFPSGPAGVGPLTAGYHSCDWCVILL